MLRTIGVLLASVVVTCRTSEHLFQNKFNAGHFEGEASKVLVEPVKRKLDCAYLCFGARPLCQSFNVRPISTSEVVPEDGWSFTCEVLQEVPPSLTTNIDNYFRSEAGAAYYEMVYDPMAETLPLSSEIDALSTDTGQCWTGVTRWNGSLVHNKYCMKGYTDLKTWDDARAVCVQDGGQLAEARTRVRHKAISDIGLQLIKSKGYSSDTFTWIGGQGIFVGTKNDNRATSKQWTWQDGTPIVKFDWLFSEPNELDDRDCVCILHSFTNEDLWQDEACNKGQGVFVCEYEHVERL